MRRGHSRHAAYGAHSQDEGAPSAMRAIMRPGVAHCVRVPRTSLASLVGYYIAIRSRDLVDPRSMRIRGMLRGVGWRWRGFGAREMEGPLRIAVDLVIVVCGGL